MENDTANEETEIKETITHYKFLIRSSEFLNGGGIAIMLTVFASLQGDSIGNVIDKSTFLMSAGILVIGLGFTIMANVSILSLIRNQKTKRTLDAHTLILIAMAIPLVATSFLLFHWNNYSGERMEEDMADLVLKLESINKKNKATEKNQATKKVQDTLNEEFSRIRKEKEEKALIPKGSD